MKSRDQIDQLEAGHARNQSREAVTQAISKVSQIDAGIDVKGLIKNLKAIEGALNGNGSLADVIKYLSTTITELQKVRTEADQESRFGTTRRRSAARVSDPEQSGVQSGTRQPRRSPISSRCWPGD